MGNIKFGQLLVASGLSFLIFAGIYITEKSRFEEQLTVTNPFSEAIELNQDVDINIGEKSQDLFTKAGEFWRIFPETEVVFSGKKREVRKGKVLFSGNYISVEDAEDANSSYRAPFNPEAFKPMVGQVKVGKAVVNAPGATTLIHRDILRDEIVIYAHDHSIEIFLPGSETPFILPARNQITMKESRLERTGLLFYTKLKKEFRMKAIAEVIVTAESTMKPPVEVTQALAAREEKFQRIKTYASQSVFSATRFKPASFMGIFANTTKYIQRHYAVGYKKSEKIEYKYETMIRDMLNAFFAFEEGNPAEAQESAEKFAEKLNSSEWVRFMIENPQYAHRWEIFSRSQKIWLQNIFPDDPERVFKVIWFPVEKIKDFETFKNRFYEVEKTIAQGFTTQARDQMTLLSGAFINVTDITPNEAVQVTKIRRLLGEILRQDTFLRSPEIFELYTKLIQSENTLYEANSEEQKEIALESAQDILFFIKEFIESETGTEISQILVKGYKILDIDKIANDLGRKIFTNDELDTIQVVQFINNSKLSAEDIANIQEQQSLLDLSRRKLQELEQEEADRILQEQIVDDSIKNGEELTELLRSNGVNIQGIVIKERAKDDNLFIIFEDATYNGIKVSGTFETSGQIFRLLKVGSISEKSDLIEITPDIMPRMIVRMAEDSKLNQEVNNPIVVDEGPSNDTSLALISRTVVSRKLKNQSINASREKIKILNDDFTLYEVKQATLDNRYRISFIFDDKNGEVSNVSVEAGRNEFELIDQVFDMSQLGAQLRTEITAQLDQELE